jgi:hypothetical protein
MPNKIGDHLHAPQRAGAKMRLYRGVHPESVETDRKKPDEFISDWIRRDRIWLKGTKTPGAERDTDLFLEIEEADVIALFRALLERYTESGEHAIALEVLALCLKSTVRPLAADLLNSNRPLEDLGLSGRTYGQLKNARIQTVGELAQKTELEMLMICGRKSLNEIKEVLSSMRLALKPGIYSDLLGLIDSA